jgi:hypothetical protein
MRESRRPERLGGGSGWLVDCGAVAADINATRTQVVADVKYGSPWQLVEMTKGGVALDARPGPVFRALAGVAKNQDLRISRKV